MSKNSVGGLAKIALLLAAFSCFLYAANPKCDQAQNLFQDKCSMCHGPDGKGYAAIHTPNFTDPKWQAEHKDSELVDAITNGKQGEGVMPPFKDQLTAQQVDNLVKCVVRGFGKAQK